jgi:Zn-dependent M28 family amino/carboxypeptidase
MSHKGSHAARVSVLVALVLLCLLVAAAFGRASASAMTYNQTVAGLVNGVDADQAELQATLNEVTGTVPTFVGGQPYTIFTRYNGSASASMAQQYVYEKLLSYGLAVNYQSYAGGRNVVAEIRGTTRPNEIIVVGGHLDDMPSSGNAPGADDNASQVAATLYLAKHFAQYGFARTIRFVFFDGEEVGYTGSSYYSLQAKAAGDNIVVYMNTDMIGWDPGTHYVLLNTRKVTSSTMVEQWAANQYTDALGAYSIGTIATIVQPLGWNVSDNRGFWKNGYQAVYLCEDQRNSVPLNPNYHTSADTVASLTLPFYYQVVKGEVAAYAHLAYIAGTLPASEIYVQNIALSAKKSGSSYVGTATITVHDASGTPVVGASVAGAWSGCVSGTASGTTDDKGKVTFTSPTSKSGGSWTFTVTTVSKVTWTYNAARNVMTSATIRYP